MSRIGKKLIKIASGVEIKNDNNRITVKGQKGELVVTLDNEFEVKLEDDIIEIINNSVLKEGRAKHGLYRALLANMVTGVSNGFEKALEIIGVGYRVAQDGKSLVFTVGYSHPVTVTAPEGIELFAEGQSKVKVIGVDRQLVGQVAADIRSIRKPDPYKGKGIRYVGEIIRKKQGKSVKK